MKTKYDVEIPKTREELMQEATFEWIKTERSGDISKFKELKVENGVEYIVFQDGTRVNSSLIGEVILQHQYENEVLGALDSAFEKTVASVKPLSQTSHAAVPTPLENSLPRSTRVVSPVMTILERSKKKKKKFQLEMQVEVPSAEILNVIRENFDTSDDELFEFFVSKIDRKKFVNSLISSISNK